MFPLHLHPSCVESNDAPARRVHRIKMKKLDSMLENELRFILVKKLDLYKLKYVHVIKNTC